MLVGGRQAWVRGWRTAGSPHDPVSQQEISEEGSHKKILQRAEVFSVSTEGLLCSLHRRNAALMLPNVLMESQSRSAIRKVDVCFHEPVSRSSTTFLAWLMRGPTRAGLYPLCCLCQQCRAHYVTCQTRMPVKSSFCLQLTAWCNGTIDIDSGLNGAALTCRKRRWKRLRGSMFQAMLSVMAVKIQLSSPSGVFLSVCFPGILSMSSFVSPSAFSSDLEQNHLRATCTTLSTSSDRCEQRHDCSEAYSMEDQVTLSARECFAAALSAHKISEGRTCQSMMKSSVRARTTLSDCK